RFLRDVVDDRHGGSSSMVKARLGQAEDRYDDERPPDSRFCVCLSFPRRLAPPGVKRTSSDIARCRPAARRSEDGGRPCVGRRARTEGSRRAASLSLVAGAAHRLRPIHHRLLLLIGFVSGRYWLITVQLFVADYSLAYRARPSGPTPNEDRKSVV